MQLVIAKVFTEWIDIMDMIRAWLIGTGSTSLELSDGDSGKCKDVWEFNLNFTLFVPLYKA